MYTLRNQSSVIHFNMLVGDWGKTRLYTLIVRYHVIFSELGFYIWMQLYLTINRFLFSMNFR